MSEAVNAATEQVVTPWEVSAGEAGVDYVKLTDQWGAKILTPELVAATEAATGATAHSFLRRELFYAHRDWDRILKLVTEHDAAVARARTGHTFPFFLYTGRGPSSGSLHMGHLIPMNFTSWLQRTFRVPCVVQLTDDEKYIWKKNLDLDELRFKIARANAAEICAAGFVPELTLIFQNSDSIYLLADVINELDVRFSFHTLEKVFGFSTEDSALKPVFPSIQMAPCFFDCFLPLFTRGDETPAQVADLRQRLRRTQCVVPMAIDQDPYFRALRATMPQMGAPPVAMLLAKFLPSLAGAGTKMSASSASSAIYVTDDNETIAAKITAAWNPADPAPFVEWVTVFEPSDERLAAVEADATSGDAERVDRVRVELIELITREIETFRQRRATITEEVLCGFYAQNKKWDQIEWSI